MTALLMIALIVGCLIFVYFVLINPLVCIIQCAGSTKSSGMKTFWVLFLFVFWGIGGFVYGLLGTDSSRLRGFTIKSIAVMLLAFGTSFGVYWANPELREQVSEMIEAADAGQLAKGEFDFDSSDSEITAAGFSDDIDVDNNESLESKQEMLQSPEDTEQFEVETQELQQADEPSTPRSDQNMASDLATESDQTTAFAPTDSQAIEDLFMQPETTPVAQPSVSQPPVAQPVDSQPENFQQENLRYIAPKTRGLQTNPFVK